jgi:hypothetical protein
MGMAQCVLPPWCRSLGMNFEAVNGTREQVCDAGGALFLALITKVC